MSRIVSSRADIAPFHVMEVLRDARLREASGHDVLHLEVGQPSTGAPPAALAALANAVESGSALGYTDAVGTAELRTAIASYESRRSGATVDPDAIAVTAGASAAFVLTFLAAFEPGARVGITRPGYPCYRQILSALGMVPIDVPVGSTQRMQPTPVLLDDAGPLDGLVVASPSNPTGSVLTPTELGDIAAWCDETDVRLIVDEIYHGITYHGPAASALRHPDVRPVVVGSFSKYFSMTGWRVGWLVAPRELIRPVELLAQNLFIAPSTIGQIAALAALDDTPALDAHVARYARNRAIVLDGLAAMRCERVAPADGAFYAWAEVSHLSSDSATLCQRWLTDLGVAATPGIDFDPVDGHRWIRLAFAGATPDVAAAMDRLVEDSR